MVLNLLLYLAAALFWMTPGVPDGIATDSSGNVYVADTTNSLIRTYDNNGNTLPVTWSTTGVPSGIATDDSNNVYVGDTTNNVVRKYNAAGVAFPVTFPTSAAPIGVAVDHLGNVYVSNLNNIQKFNSTGTLINTLVLPLSGVPGGVAVDSLNNLYVVDGFNFLVQKYNSAGVAGISWATASQPVAIAVDALNNVYVSETFMPDDRIEKFDSNGNFITRLGDLLPGMLGLTTDPFGDVFVSGLPMTVIKLIPVVQANPTTVAADGTTTSTITVTLQDLNYNPRVGDIATLVANGGSSIISAASGPADANGQVTFTVRDAVQETVVYTATDVSYLNTMLRQTAQVTFANPVVQPLPPTHFIGSVVKNKFLTQTDIINVLAWDGSLSVDVVAYRLFQNGVLVAEISAFGPLTATLHNRHKHESYTLVSVSSLGVQSVPVSLTLP